MPEVNPSLSGETLLPSKCQSCSVTEPRSENLATDSTHLSKASIKPLRLDAKKERHGLLPYIQTLNTKTLKADNLPSVSLTPSYPNGYPTHFLPAPISWNRKKKTRGSENRQISTFLP